MTLSLKLALRGTLSACLHKAGALKLFSDLLGPPWRILMYHRVIDPQETTEVIEPGMYVHPKTFEMQMDYLSSSCNVLTLDNLVALIKAKKHIPRRTVAITFDDGWKDNYLFAFPILKKRNLPATIFLATSFIDTTQDFLTWQDIHEMYRQKISFGCHSHFHHDMTTLSREQLNDDLKQSLETLSQNQITPSSVFCYPKGYHNALTQESVSEAGFACALTTDKDSSLHHTPLALLKRVAIHDDITNTISNYASRVWMGL